MSELPAGAEITGSPSRGRGRHTDPGRALSANYRGKLLAG